MWIDFYKKPPTAGNKGYLLAKKAAVGAKLVPGPEDTEFSQLCRNREGRATSRMAARMY